MSLDDLESYVPVEINLRKLPEHLSEGGFNQMTREVGLLRRRGIPYTNKFKDYIPLRREIVVTQEPRKEFRYIVTDYMNCAACVGIKGQMVFTSRDLARSQ